jgi:hypothetical protein
MEHLLNEVVTSSLGNAWYRQAWSRRLRRVPGTFEETYPNLQQRPWRKYGSPHATISFDKAGSTIGGAAARLPINKLTTFDQN